MEKEFKTLSEKEFVCDKSFAGYDNVIVLRKKDAKEKIQNVRKRLKDLCKKHGDVWEEDIDKIFKEEFGDKLIK